jgi:DNA polymerase II large subunit
MKSSVKKEDLCASLNISTEDLDHYVKNPLSFYPKPVEALKLSQSLIIPLHPRYTYLWHDILPEELNNLLEWLMQAKMKYNGEFCSEIRIDNTNFASKNTLEKLCVPHIVENDKIVISHHAPTLAYCLGIQKDITLEEIHSKIQTKPMMTDVLFIINALSDIEVRAKAPIFIGGRLGRPEKSKARATSPPVHVLFPVGFNVGHNRNIVDIAKNGDVSLELVRKECPDCHYTSFMNLCSRCGHQTVIALKCPKCSTVSRKNVCPNCKTPIRGFESQKVSLQRLLDEALRKTGLKHIEKVKGVKGLTSKFKQPEILEKGILRSKYGLYVYKDGTTRFDATDAPLSHFKPKEIKTSIDSLKDLGYTHDYMGNPLTDDDQILELKVQDIIIHDECGDYLVNVAKFIDELLVKVYEQPAFYNITKKEQLIGHLVIGLAPHTSAGVTARIVGFTDAYVCYAHHYFHAAKRRNCDGDEDSILLLLDGLLNFSKMLLPAKRGGMMDAPLVLTVCLDPHEIDDESYTVDQVANYSLEFYNKTLDSVDPKDVEDIIDNVGHRLNSPAQYAGFRFSHPTSSIAAGPSCTAYKTLDSMEKKVVAQLNLAKKIRAVNAKDVAERVFSHHLLRDIIGCLRRFGRQKVRCTTCNRKYRRIPLTGNCPNCGGKLILTVSEGTVMKYLDLAENIVNGQDLDLYHKQRIILLKKALESLFEDDSPKQVKLGEYI